jgi:hypothetical protein
VAVATISPDVHFVGDLVVATMSLTVDRGRADPSGIAVLAVFAPYSRVGPIEVERRDAGPVTLLRYTFPLQCVDRACLARASSGPLTFPQAILRYASPIGQALLSVGWPAVTPVSRITGADPEDPALRTGSLAAPVPGYRVDPDVLGWLFASLSAALVLTAGLLVARRVRPAPARQLVAAVAAPNFSPIEHALGLVERAEARGEGERRAALDTLARALEDGGSSPHAPRARRLAWSQAVPAPRELAELASEIRAGLEAEG